MYLAELAILEIVLVGAGLLWRLRQRRLALPLTGAQRSRAVEPAVLAALTVLAPAAVELAPTPIRVTLGCCALLLAPGAAVLTFWPVRDVLDRLVLAVVLSGTALLLLSMAMIWIDLWSPLLLVHLSALVAAPILAWCALDALTEPTAAHALPRGGVR